MINPEYRILYKRHSALGQYYIRTAQTIDDVVKCVEKLFHNSNCYDITIESSIKLKINDYDIFNIEQQIREFDKLIIKD